MRILTFRLEGPLQSWGALNYFGANRSTAAFPTKSAVTGLLCSCMGWARNDARVSTLNEKILMGVRADRRGLPMTDFQTIHTLPRLNLLDTAHPLSPGMLMTMSGKNRADTGQVSRRTYLQDASFVVGISSADDGLLNEMYSGLCHPAHTIYLGRKSCVLSAPLNPELHEYASLEEALTAIPRTARSDCGDLEAEIDAQAMADHDSQIGAIRVDALMHSFVADKDTAFKARQIVIKALHVAQKGAEYVPNSTDAV